ncbi:MAG TPA: stalk domain-containing protein [Symbiobacteriaceae bacterium]|nr:stalk domain-containing protein [Symbiobacteriaceae bacterium]
MKFKSMRSLLAVLGIGALLVALVAVVPSATQAANLTGGNYTYLINGEEVTFMFDPVVRKDGLLLPTEVFQQFGIAVAGATTRTPSVSKDDLVVKLNLGSTQVDLAGQVRTVATAPLRLNGRLFLPADLLKEFGIDFVQDGTMVIMRPLVEEMPKALTLTEAQWDAFTDNRGFRTNLKTDAGVFVMAEMILLNKDVINSTNMGSYGTRAKLLSMLETNTLILVQVSNLSTRSGGLQTAGAYLVDDLRRQYDNPQVIDIGQGLLTAKLSPGADRMGVMAFPKVADNAKSVSMFFDTNIANVGTFPVVK